MKKKSLCQRIAMFLLAITVVFVSTPQIPVADESVQDVSPAFVEIEPFMTAYMRMVTDATEVAPGERFSVSVYWRRSSAANYESIAIGVTEDAVIVPSSISFEANGIPGSASTPIRTPGNLGCLQHPPRNASSGEYVVRFHTSAPATVPLLNRVTFYVEAPSNAEDFTLSVKVGREETLNSIRNFIYQTFDVYLPFSVAIIDATDNSIIGNNVINGSSPFLVSIESDFDPGRMVDIQIAHTETGHIFNQTSGNLDSNGNFITPLPPFTFSASDSDGRYRVDVWIICNLTWDADERTVYIELVRPTLTIRSTADYVCCGIVGESCREYYVYCGDSFVLYGEINNIGNPNLIRARILYGDTVVYEMEGDFVGSDEFSFLPFSFNPSHDTGMYRIEVSFLDTSFNPTEGAINIELRRDIPAVDAITVTVDPTTVLDAESFDIIGSYTVAYAGAYSVWLEIRDSAADPATPPIMSGNAQLLPNGGFDLLGQGFAVTTPSGNYTIVAILRDSAGDKLTRSSVNIQRDLTPSPVSVSVSPTAVFNNDPYRVSGSVVTDYTGLLRVRLEKWPAVGQMITSGTIDVAPDRSFSIGNRYFTPDVPTGTYNIRAIVYRANGGEEVGRNFFNFQRFISTFNVTAN
ncbi:MAG: hypothetical protein FWF80_01650 [Defluviitaleaceae bacterium]|nr:hypothetical protein [Defluviitaleaceae bacterium]